MTPGGLEVNLPDLPEISIRLGADDASAPAAGPARRLRPRLVDRLRDTLAAYLPLLLMVVLALATWWLVKQVPPAPTAAAVPLPSGVPDYTMRGFTLERYAKDGRRVLSLEGRQMRHFPENDRIDIEEVRLQAELPSGGTTAATARQAVANNKASEVRLLGGAVVQGKTRDGQDVQVDSEFLLYRSADATLSTDRPVRVRIGDSRTLAAGLNWNLDSRALELKPPVRSVLQPRSAREDPP
jgi:lipopolysaccharide export system protein LptC